MRLSCHKTVFLFLFFFFFLFRSWLLRIARQWAALGSNLPDSIETTSHAWWDSSIASWQCRVFQGLCHFKIVYWPWGSFSDSELCFCIWWRLKGNPLAEPTNPCLARPFCCHYSVPFQLPALLNSAPGIVDICWPRGPSLCLHHQQSSPFHVGYSCPITWKFTSRARLVCFPSLWFLLTLCFLLPCVLSPSCTFPFSQLFMAEVQLRSLNYRQQRTPYIDSHQTALFLLT